MEHKTITKLLPANERSTKLGLAFRSIRCEKNMAIVDFHDIISGTSMSLIERGVRGCDDEIFGKLCARLGITLEHLEKAAGLVEQKVMEEAPAEKKPPQDGVILVNNPPAKLPNGLTALQTWSMTINMLKQRGRCNAML